MNNTPIIYPDPKYPHLPSHHIEYKECSINIGVTSLKLVFSRLWNPDGAAGDFGYDSVVNCSLRLSGPGFTFECQSGLPPTALQALGDYLSNPLDKQYPSDCMQMIGPRHPPYTTGWITRLFGGVNSKRDTAYLGVILALGSDSYWASCRDHLEFSDPIDMTNSEAQQFIVRCRGELAMDGSSDSSQDIRRLTYSLADYLRSLT